MRLNFAQFYGFFFYFDNHIHDRNAARFLIESAKFELVEHIFTN